MMSCGDATRGNDALCGAKMHLVSVKKSITNIMLKN